jgi:hypothetical protein
MMLSTKAMKMALAIAVFALAGVAYTPIANANSALDQYVEEVPDTNGNHNPSDNGADRGSKGGHVDKKATNELQNSGDDGQALLAIADSSGPTSGGTAGQAKDKSGTGAGSGSENGEDRVISDRNSSVNPVKSLTGAAEASGFNAPLFGFVVLLAIAMAAITWRRRTGTHSS